MQRALSLYSTTIGKKVLVAITGLILFGFVIGHMLGNLQIFLGPEKINAYTEFLHGTPSLLWGTRITLLVSVVIHITLTMQLAGRNSGARSQRYEGGKKDLVTSYAAKTMVLSGPIIALYLVYHLAHLTVGVSMDPTGYAHSTTDLYSNLVHGFSIWWVSAIYIFANLLLGLHLYHGAWSLFQSMGVSHPKLNPLRQRIAVGLALLITVGNCSIPISVLAGLVH